MVAGRYASEASVEFLGVKVGAGSILATLPPSRGGRTYELSVTVHGRSTRVGVRAVATDDLVVRSVTAYAQNARTHRTVQAELDSTGTVRLDAPVRMGPPSGPFARRLSMILHGGNG